MNKPQKFALSAAIFLGGTLLLVSQLPEEPAGDPQPTNTLAQAKVKLNHCLDELVMAEVYEEGDTQAQILGKLELANKEPGVDFLRQAAHDALDSNVVNTTSVAEYASRSDVDPITLGAFKCVLKARRK